MTTLGTVRVWYDDEGWGVIDSDETPGGCWAHFSDVRMLRAASLRAGDRVRFDWETAHQDGYAFRAQAVWPDDGEPIEPWTSMPGPAYSSSLTVTFEDPHTGHTVVHHASGDDPEAMERLQALMRERRAADQQFGWTSLRPGPTDQ